MYTRSRSDPAAGRSPQRRDDRGGGDRSGVVTYAMRGPSHSHSKSQQSGRHGRISERVHAAVGSMSSSSMAEGGGRGGSGLTTSKSTSAASGSGSGGGGSGIGRRGHSSHTSSGGGGGESRERGSGAAGSSALDERVALVTEGVDSEEACSILRRSVEQYDKYRKRVERRMSARDGRDKIMTLVYDLTEKEKREESLASLSKHRENCPDLAPLLWGTPGVVAALLQEVISVYPYLSGVPTLTTSRSNRCCNALALLQCVASHPETRVNFLRAYIPLYLYPFLNAKMNTKPFEYLRLTSLGCIGALVKQPHPSVSEPNSMPDRRVTEFLVSTEAIPFCLNIMEYGNELSKTVATFIIQKILLDNYGLSYICKTPERFFAVSRVLQNMINEQHASSRPSNRLVKHAIRCYLRLCDDARAHEALRAAFPSFLSTDTVKQMFSEDATCLQWIESLNAKLRPTAT